MKAKLILIFITVLVIGLIGIIACSSSSEDSTDDDRKACVQATDCGSGGRSQWVCSPEGECFTASEYCYVDTECVGACVAHVCEGGKDRPDITDGDVDKEIEAEKEAGQIPCEFACCTNDDCAEGDICDKTTDTCVTLIECPEKECCQDYTCRIDPNFGLKFICKFNKCIDPDAPCPFDCCTNDDCPEGSYCITAEGEDQGTCRNNTFSCTPGDKTCCTKDPGNPDCIALGALRSEGVLTCNTAGDAYELSMCPEFQDCFPSGNATISCDPNGRCDVDDDCTCPKLCFDTPNGLKCMMETVKENETCWLNDLCETGNPGQSANCEEGFICTAEEGKDGVCVAEKK